MKGASENIQASGLYLALTNTAALFIQPYAINNKSLHLSFQILFIYSFLTNISTVFYIPIFKNSTFS